MLDTYCRLTIIIHVRIMLIIDACLRLLRIEFYEKFQTMNDIFNTSENTYYYRTFLQKKEDIVHIKKAKNSRF
jgi:hypothetical protein